MESYILQCKFTPSHYPPIESIEAPLPFKTIQEFEKWLREKYILRTSVTDYIDDPLTKMPFDVKKTECWGFFQPMKYSNADVRHIVKPKSLQRLRFFYPEKY